MASDAYPYTNVGRTNGGMCFCGKGMGSQRPQGLVIGLMHDDYEETRRCGSRCKANVAICSFWCFGQTFNSPFPLTRGWYTAAYGSLYVIFNVYVNDRHTTTL